MRLTFGLTWVAALVGSTLGRPAAQEDSAVSYVDAETGFTFSEYKVAYSLSGNVVFRVATPAAAVQGQPFDIVLQIVSPTSGGWAAVAWGGSMVKNPITMGWANGQSTVVSSRWASGRTLPGAYTGATYTKLSNGNKVNGTHWQLTVKCTGCSAWDNIRLNPKGSNRLALGYANAKVSQPSSNTSSFGIHDVHPYWTQDFTQGANPNWDALLVRNGVA
ncbi:iron reductase domain protein [Aaosphaeria arxii CBS 175.79]|uniref:Iron reductase domain protein n=1 Tax=Aaosphaeria arxii CBS 175.79 TaxID=1450172 RepID=A0A6A5YBA3_9PLEO|nr:iron reductase domain protein [Aaosphaeria arxii CBS 175.79]KAF2022307.1 iron reductase domain protein [Aaosphaeria arxii CBS 175.79]